jgi:hypothetical protein
LTDGDLKPSDADREENVEFPRIEDLKKYENNFVRVFHCKTTFEWAMALANNLMVFSKAAEELGASNVSGDLKDYYDRRADLKNNEKKQAMDKVLNTAKRFGKARLEMLRRSPITSRMLLSGLLNETY